MESYEKTRIQIKSEIGHCNGVVEAAELVKQSLSKECDSVKERHIKIMKSRSEVLTRKMTVRCEKVKYTKLLRQLNCYSNLLDLLSNNMVNLKQFIPKLVNQHVLRGEIAVSKVLHELLSHNKKLREERFRNISKVRQQENDSSKLVIAIGKSTSQVERLLKKKTACDLSFHLKDVREKLKHERSTLLACLLYTSPSPRD